MQHFESRNNFPHSKSWPHVAYWPRYSPTSHGRIWASWHVSVMTRTQGRIVVNKTDIDGWLLQGYLFAQFCTLPIKSASKIFSTEIEFQCNILIIHIGSYLSRVIFIFLIIIESTLESPKNPKGRKRSRQKKQGKARKQTSPNKNQIRRLIQNDQPIQPTRNNRINERDRRAPYPRKISRPLTVFYISMFRKRVWLHWGWLHLHGWGLWWLLWRLLCKQLRW